MGLMDMLGGLMGKRKTGNPLIDALLPMLAGGGLGVLIGKMAANGLGNKAHSWVGTGANEAIEPHEIEQGLGADTVSKLAQQTGMSNDAVKGGLAGMLPKLIDQLTPGGQVGQLGSVGKLAKGLNLSKLLGN
jgi:uncharacterized protein YidB (DUF937 family)